MSILNDNYRYEIKYLLNKKKAEVLKKRLALIMDKDLFSNSNNEYYIRSLYFDDIYNTAYYEKINGLFNRVKYRIRYYNFDDSYISLELKGKMGNLSYKRRDNLSREETLLLKEGNVDLIDIGDRKVLAEFVDLVKKKNLKPSVIVDYKRTAFIYSYEDVRITFDEDISSGRFNYDLFDKDMELYKVLNNDEVILEVKYNNKLPSILNDVIKTIPMVKVAFSKFTISVERKLM